MFHLLPWQQAPLLCRIPLYKTHIHHTRHVLWHNRHKYIQFIHSLINKDINLFASLLVEWLLSQQENTTHTPSIRVIPSVSLSATPLNTKLSFISSIWEASNHKYMQNPGSILCSSLRCLVHLSPNSSAGNTHTHTHRKRQVQLWREINWHLSEPIGSCPLRGVANWTFSCKRKAGLRFLSNAWLSGSGGGWFNMAAAATRSGNSGIFWMNSGMLTFVQTALTQPPRPLPIHI